MARNQPVRLAPPKIVVSSILSSQTVEIAGVIRARSGATVQGVLKARRKEMSMGALVPGLQIQVGPTHHEQRQLSAKVIGFRGNDSERALAIQSGLDETQAQAQRNREDLEKNRREELEKQNAALKAQTKSLKQQQGELTPQQDKIAGNKTAINAALPRFGQLDDYYVTEYFGNSRVAIDPQCNASVERACAQFRSVGLEVY